MRAESEPSVSHWILGAKVGDAVAVRALWERYFRQLVRLAGHKLHKNARGAADEEDVAVSVFASFCCAAEAGRFPNLTNRDDLWRLLMRLTARKAIDQARRERCEKRGGGRVRGESSLAGEDWSRREEGLAQVIGDIPTPEFAAMVAEEYNRLLGKLSEELRAVAIAKMESYTNEEVARQLDCSVATIERRLQLIRTIWRRESAA